jgi:hypothetical protein
VVRRSHGTHMERAMAPIRTDIRNMKDDVRDIKGDIRNVKGDICDMKLPTTTL